MNAAQCCESHALELVQSRESGPGLTARHGLLSSQQTHQVRFPLHFFSFRSDGLVTIVRDSPGQRNPLDIYFFWNCGLPIIFHSSNWWSLKQDQTLRFLSFWSVFLETLKCWSVSHFCACLLCLLNSSLIIPWVYLQIFSHSIGLRIEPFSMSTKSISFFNI